MLSAPVSFLFRSLTLEEIPSLATLQEAIFQPGEVWSESSLSALLEDPRGIGWGGFTPEGGLHAFLLARVVAGEGEILTLGVHPAHRRRGYARRMVEWLQNEVRMQGVHTLFLEVAEDNRAARTLYEGVGFKAVGRRPDYYAAGRSGVVLRWTPAPPPDKGGSQEDGAHPPW